MAIQQYKLMHGAVLHKICSNGKPFSLTLVEKDDSRSTYHLNNEVAIYVKHSVTPKSFRPNKTVWKFSFSPKHLQDIAKLFDERQIYVALVCAQKQLKDMEVALLEPADIKQLLDLGNATKGRIISVEAEPDHKLRVYRRKKCPILVSRNSLDEWEVPGRVAQ